MRGVKRALETPPKPHEELKADRRRSSRGRVAKRRSGQDHDPGRQKGFSED